MWVNSEILAPGQIVPMQSKATVRFHYCFGRELCTDSQAEFLASVATTHTKDQLPAKVFDFIQVTNPQQLAPAAEDCLPVKYKMRC